MRLPILLAAAMAAVSIAAHANSITYNFSQTIGTSSASGTITTDGTIGTLSLTDIQSFTITLTVNANSVSSDATESARVAGSNLTATSTGLFFDFSGSNGFFILFPNNQNAGTLDSNYLCLIAGPNNTCSGVGMDDIEIGIGGVSQRSATLSANQQIASVTAVTPEPSSFALLGMGLLGVVGVLRKRGAA